MCEYCGRQPNARFTSCEGCGAPTRVLEVYPRAHGSTELMRYVLGTSPTNRQINDALNMQFYTGPR